MIIEHKHAIPLQGDTKKYIAIHRNGNIHYGTHNTF